MVLQPIDHVFAATLVAAIPYFGIWEYRRLVRQLAAGVPSARIRGYALTMLIEWGLALSALAIWFSLGRDPRTVGIAWESGPRAWSGYAAAVAVIMLLLVQTQSAVRSREKLEAVSKQLVNMEALLPRSPGEISMFNALSVTAGICEEVVYRGFLLAYFGALFDTWIAVLLAAVVFGIGHAYQGRVGILKTGVIGLVFAGLYLLTGSLWAPIVVHAFIDINSGYLGRRALVAVRYGSPT